MNPTWESPEYGVQLYLGDCLAILPTLAPGSVDAVVTDPPAGISFMGKAWDHHKGGRDSWIEWMAGIAAECLRILKPGGHALVWALPRTSHWTATAWENAGFQVRDRIAFLFGSGFPKSLDVSKAIDKEAGEKQHVIGRKIKHADTWTSAGREIGRCGGEYAFPITAPATAAAKHWQGWGTALKPACEDWWLLRKPLSEKTVAANVLAHGTGGINVDGCRIASGTEHMRGNVKYSNGGALAEMRSGGKRDFAATDSPLGRFPANVIHDGSPEVLAGFPESEGGNFPSELTGRSCFGLNGLKQEPSRMGDSGSAARFFYCAKASKQDRDEGLRGLPERFDSRIGDGIGGAPSVDGARKHGQRNHHPTVKSTALMRYLCRLITPPNGIILDPFMGSGSTGKAAIAEGFRFIGIEREPEYMEIAAARIKYAIENQEQDMFGPLPNEPRAEQTTLFGKEGKP